MSSLKKILVIPGCGYQESIHRVINSTKKLELLDFNTIILTGGVRAMNEEPFHTEAEVMEDYLLEKMYTDVQVRKRQLQTVQPWEKTSGLYEKNKDKIKKRIRVLEQNVSKIKNSLILDNNALDTYQNIENSIILAFEENQGTNNSIAITFVSDKQHLRRFRISSPKILQKLQKSQLKKGYIPNPISFEYIPVTTRGGIKTAFMEIALSLVHTFDPTGSGWLARRNRKNRLQK